MSRRRLTDPPNRSYHPPRRRPPHDHTALWRLAALDSASLPPAPLMIGEVDGAVSIADGRAIADPFYPTAHIVALLQTHAAAPTRPSERRVSFRYRLRWGREASACQPA